MNGCVSSRSKLLKSDVLVCVCSLLEMSVGVVSALSVSLTFECVLFPFSPAGGLSPSGYICSSNQISNEVRYSNLFYVTLIIFPWLVAVPSACLAVAVFDWNCGRLCNSVDSIVLHIPTSELALPRRQLVAMLIGGSTVGVKGMLHQMMLGSLQCLYFLSTLGSLPTWRQLFPAVFYLKQVNGGPVVYHLSPDTVPSIFDSESNGPSVCLCSHVQNICCN